MDANHIYETGAIVARKNPCKYKLGFFLPLENEKRNKEPNWLRVRPHSD